MTSKQRVHAAIRHEQSDKLPRFIWFGAATKEILQNELGLSPEQFQKEFGNDILSTWVSINGEMEREIAEGEKYIDEWGITWVKDGYYNMVTDHPLMGKDADYIKNYPLPDPLASSRYEVLEDLIKTEGDNYFIGADVSGTIFEPAYHLRDMQELMIDLAMENPKADILLDRLMEFSLEVSIQCIKKGVDWVWLGDDMGAQRGMMMSPDMWRKHFKPRMKYIIDGIRAYKEDAIIAYHSCGSILPIIGDLVEIGIDVLNPIQESAADMDQNNIKSLYGDKITMMCGPDTQQFMSTASPDEVYNKTLEIVKNLNTGGGYIFAVSHTIQPDTPLENVRAMLKAIDV